MMVKANRTVGIGTVFLVSLSFLSGCQRQPPAERPANGELAPAYTRNAIVDPALREVAETIRTQALQEAGADRRALYSRVEVLPPAQTVQPYGVGVYQQEPRLPVILTTGPAWAGLKQADKETRVAKTFRAIAAQLEALKRTPPLQLTLTIQTPQGEELGWINHLDPSGKNLHGDE
jgi:GAF domain-containing protein